MVQPQLIHIDWVSFWYWGRLVFLAMAAAWVARKVHQLVNRA